MSDPVDKVDKAKNQKAADRLTEEIPTLERRDTETGANYKRSIYALPVEVQVVIGTATLTISDLLRLEVDQILELDKTVNDPVDLCIDNRVIARGELVETEPGSGALALKITQIVDISEDLL
jgi:flagellar motor switch protein FliN/FliY